MRKKNYSRWREVYVPRSWGGRDRAGWKNRKKVNVGDTEGWGRVCEIGVEWRRKTDHEELARS